MSAAIKISRARHSGDPGLGSFLKKAAMGVAGFLTGGPVGAVAGVLGSGGMGGSRVPQRAPQRTLPRGSLPAIGAAGGFAAGRMGLGNGCGPGRIKVAGRCVSPGDAFPGGADFVTPGPGTAIGCPSGFHPNKSEYFLRDGTFVPKGSKCVKNRRRNAMNPRALDRAIGRLNSAKRLQSKLSGFSTKKYTASGKKKKC